MKHERFELNELDYNKFREILNSIDAKRAVYISIYEDGIDWHYVFEHGRLGTCSKTDVHTCPVYGEWGSTTLYTEEDRFRDSIEISYFD